MIRSVLVFWCLIKLVCPSDVDCDATLRTYHTTYHRLMDRQSKEDFHRGIKPPDSLLRGTDWIGIFSDESVILRALSNSKFVPGVWMGKRLDGDNTNPLKWCFQNQKEYNLPLFTHMAKNNGSVVIVYDNLPFKDEMRWMPKEEVIVGKSMIVNKNIGYYYLFKDEGEHPTPFSNFYGDIVFRPPFRPSDVSDLESFVKRTNDPLTIIASGRSFGANVAGDSKATYVLLDQLRKYGIGQGTVWVEPGVTFDDLTRPMIDAGWSFPTYPAVTPPTVIGALTTNSHGSGATAMANHVIEMTVYTADGVTRRIDQTSEDWGAWLMSMGDLGIIVNATFRTEPLYVLSERWYEVESTNHALQRMKENDCFVVIQDKVLFQEVRRTRASPHGDELVRWPMDTFNRIYDKLFDPIVQSNVPFEIPSILLSGFLRVMEATLNHVGYANIILPGSNHNSHRHIECELFVKRHDLLKTLRLLNAWKYDSPGFNNMYVMFVRHIPADTEDIALSPFRDVGRYGIIIFSYLPWTELQVFSNFLVMTGERLEKEGIDFTYHRGKYAPSEWKFDPDVIEYWRLTRQRLDPGNRFQNQFMERMMSA